MCFMSASTFNLLVSDVLFLSIAVKTLSYTSSVNLLNLLQSLSFHTFLIQALAVEGLWAL